MIEILIFVLAVTQAATGLYLLWDYHDAKAMAEDLVRSVRREQTTALEAVEAMTTEEHELARRMEARAVPE